MSTRFVVAEDRPLHDHLLRLARTARMVFVAGLPGMGKSLVIHQLAHLAVEARRAVHLLQWDMARPVFEASGTGQRYPVIDGVTHPHVRRAVGLWARRAVAAWARRYDGAEHLLLGETPLVGGRLIELARVEDDAAEALLAAPSCRFVVPVPSVDVRRHLEAERERRTRAPRHPREREDAPPGVMRDLWFELIGVARALGLADETPGREATYDPQLYRRVYETVLPGRHVEIVALERVLPTATFSVYDFSAPHADLVPGEDEADTTLRDLEAHTPDAATLAREVERWWVA